MERKLRKEARELIKQRIVEDTWIGLRKRGEGIASDEVEMEEIISYLEFNDINISIEEIKEIALEILKRMNLSYGITDKEIRVFRNPLDAIEYMKKED